jgi:hypothetical protein
MSGSSGILTLATLLMGTVCFGGQDKLLKENEMRVLSSKKIEGQQRGYLQLKCDIRRIEIAQVPSLVAVRFSQVTNVNP